MYGMMHVILLGVIYKWDDACNLTRSYLQVCRMQITSLTGVTYKRDDACNLTRSYLQGCGH